MDHTDTYALIVKLYTPHILKASPLCEGIPDSVAMLGFVLSSYMIYRNSAVHCSILARLVEQIISQNAIF